MTRQVARYGGRRAVRGVGNRPCFLACVPKWWFSSEGLALSPVCVRARMRGIMTWLCASLCRCTPTALQALHSCRSCSATRALYRTEIQPSVTPSKRSMIMLYQQTLHNMDVPVYGYKGSAVHGRASRPFRHTPHKQTGHAPFTPFTGGLIMPTSAHDILLDNRLQTDGLFV